MEERRLITLAEARRQVSVSQRTFDTQWLQQLTVIKEGRRKLVDSAQLTRLVEHRLALSRSAALISASRASGTARRHSTQSTLDQELDRLLEARRRDERARRGRSPAR